MHGLKAHVRNGRIIVDELTNLSEGAELAVVIAEGGDELSSDERAELHASIERGIADMRAGREMDLDDFLDELDSEPWKSGFRRRRNSRGAKSAIGRKAWWKRNRSTVT